MASNEHPDLTATVASVDTVFANIGVAPRSVLPAQWSWGASSVATVSPEARLMIAVLDDAIARYLYTLRRDSRAANEERRELEDWFSGTESGWSFAFENICAVLQIEPSAIRERLATWSAPNRDALARPRRRVRAMAGDGRAGPPSLERTVA